MPSYALTEADKYLAEQRYHYELAKSSLKKQDEKAFQTHYAMLADYTLLPYIDYALASRQLSPLSKPVIEKFIHQNENSYLGNRLHRQYLHTLAQAKAWPDLIFWYRAALATPELKCLWLQARIETGDKTALEEITPIWVHPKSHPKQCDPVFSLWQKSEHFNDDLVWQRFLAASKKSNRGLARYLGSRLSEDYAPYAKLIWELDSRPYRISKYSKFAKHTPEMQHVIAFGIQKYARQAPAKAWQHWERYEAMQIFNDDIVKETKLSLINRLIQSKHLDKVREILAHSPSVRNSDTIERLIRELLREQRWQDVQTTIALLPSKARKTDRWQYWHARSHDELTKTTNPSSLTTYAELAQNRSFYGFLSADILGQSYSLAHQPAEQDEHVLKALEKQPALARAKELWLNGHTSEAYAEWYYGLNKLSSKELAAVGVLANRWGWYDRAIHAMIAGKHWDHLGIRFPLAYKKQILSAAQKTAVEPSFIFAIARQESAMSKIAKSSAGARGLMQLMPRTAMQTAQKRGITHRTEDLFQADHNINLGSQYLDELLNKFNGNRILAAAAYNAGPHRVSKWMDNSASVLPYDVWIETIPFKETRGYVQNVLTFAVIYSVRMGTPEPFITKFEAKRKL